jgi:hypothetical protein
MKALVLGATALALSAGIASAQAVVPPTPPVVSNYDAAPLAVTPPLYDYAPVPTTKSVTATKAPGPTTKWVTAPEPGPSNSSRQ